MDFPWKILRKTFTSAFDEKIAHIPGLHSLAVFARFHVASDLDFAQDLQLPNARREFRDVELLKSLHRGDAPVLPHIVDDLLPLSAAVDCLNLCHFSFSFQNCLLQKRNVETEEKLFEVGASLVDVEVDLTKAHMLHVGYVLSCVDGGG